MICNVKVIGICGRSGSGKGFVCRVFKSFGVPCIDTDLVYRELLSLEGSPCLREIVSEYGDIVLNSEKKLDRRALANIVFSDKSGNKLKRLNSITHKYILNETLSLIESFSREGFESVIIDAPVLFESRFNELCDLIFCVTAPTDILIDRICERDGRSKAEAVARLESQMDERALAQLSDEILVNDGCSDVSEQVSAIVKKYGLGGERYE